MSPKRRANRNDLFVVRFWLRDLSSEPEEQGQWRGRIQRPVSGETHEFNDWEALVKTLQTMLAATSPSYVAGAPTGGQDDPPSESSRRGEKE